MIDALDRRLARLLVEPEATSWPVSDEALIRRIEDHGIGPLLASLPGRSGALPQSVQAAIAREARARAMWEMRHRSILADLLPALRDADALVLKGTALAYSLYDPSSTRSRGDTDLLVAPEHCDAVRAALAAAGFEREPTISAVALQECWCLELSDTTQHVIDLHWATLNSPFLAGVLTYDTLIAAAQSIPDLGEGAKCPSASHQLVLLACHWALNRSGTYHVGDRILLGRTRLIGLYDVHLLAESIDRGGWDNVTAIAEREGLSRVCALMLETCRELFATRVPQEIQSQLHEHPRSGVERHLLDRRRWRRAWRDMLAVRPRMLVPRYALDRARSYLRTRLSA